MINYLYKYWRAEESKENLEERQKSWIFWASNIVHREGNNDPLSIMYIGVSNGGHEKILNVNLLFLYYYILKNKMLFLKTNLQTPCESLMWCFEMNNTVQTKGTILGVMLTISTALLFLINIKWPEEISLALKTIQLPKDSFQSKVIWINHYQEPKLALLLFLIQMKVNHKVIWCYVFNTPQLIKG